jgi:hypothetical protein
MLGIADDALFAVEIEFFQRALWLKATCVGTPPGQR